MKEEWIKIQGVLEEIVDVYEVGNRLLSFGKSEKLRREALKDLSGEGLLLDVGCGPGNMALAALSEGWKGEIIMLDPLLPMLCRAKRIGNNVNLIQAIAEYLPIRSSCIDVWIAGFSFRDFIDRERGLKELARALKKNGEGYLLDLAKPDNIAKRVIIFIYWVFSPILTFLKLGKIGLKYRGILTTYRGLPTNSKLLSLFKKMFREVSYFTKFLGGVIVIRVKGPRIYVKDRIASSYR